MHHVHESPRAVATTAPSGRSAAVVIGAGMAGLVAARALSDHVDQVVVVERDRLPHAPLGRRGVPQTAAMAVAVDADLGDLIVRLLAESA